MSKLIAFKVYDRDGKDVTNEREWYIDKNGCLYYETDDVDSPLQYAKGFVCVLV